MRISDNSFIEHLKKKHPKSLDYIIDNYSGLVNTIVTNTLISIDDRGLIEECISDIFISVWENGYKFNGDKNIDYEDLNIYEKLTGNISMDINQLDVLQKGSWEFTIE